MHYLLTWQIKFCNHIHYYCTYNVNCKLERINSTCSRYLFFFFNTNLFRFTFLFSIFFYKILQYLSGRQPGRNQEKLINNISVKLTNQLYNNQSSKPSGCSHKKGTRTFLFFHNFRPARLNKKTHNFSQSWYFLLMLTL